MSKLRVLVPTLMVIALLLLPTVVLAQPNVCGFYGTVTVNDSAQADDGTMVVAIIDGEEVASVATSGSSYSMYIDGNYEGMTVEFTIDDVVVGSETFVAGENINLDLNLVDENAVPAEGEQGPQGEKGDKGDKGDTGDTGPAGEQGPVGPAGAAGADGEDGDDGSAVLGIVAIVIAVIAVVLVFVMKPKGPEAA